MTEWTIFTSKLDLIEKRIQKGWTQLELAEYSGIHPNAIKEFEDGVRIPSNPIQMLLRITFDRLEHIINSYLKLCHSEKLEFNKHFGLTIDGKDSILIRD